MQKFGAYAHSFITDNRECSLNPQNAFGYVQNYNKHHFGRSTTLDLFMILKIGDAHISLSWQNILNTLYVFFSDLSDAGGHFFGLV